MGMQNLDQPRATTDLTLHLLFGRVSQRDAWGFSRSGVCVRLRS